MALLRDILYRVNIRSVWGNAVSEINSIQTDSRKVKPGSCFIAIRGTITDGHQHIRDAVINGAAVIICEELP